VWVYTFVYRTAVQLLGLCIAKTGSDSLQLVVTKLCCNAERCQVQNKNVVKLAASCDATPSILVLFTDFFRATCRLYHNHQYCSSCWNIRNRSWRSHSIYLNVGHTGDCIYYVHQHKNFEFWPHIIQGVSFNPGLNTAEWGESSVAAQWVPDALFRMVKQQGLQLKTHIHMVWKLNKIIWFIRLSFLYSHCLVLT
jgi:hypothetical protein